MKYKRSMEVLIDPAGAVAEQPAWVEAAGVLIRVGGHDVVVKTTKEGVEVEYKAPKNKRPKRVSAEASLEGATLRITP